MLELLTIGKTKGVTMTEFTGQLIGGPDDGNMVTSSVDKIPVVDIIQLWLDGLDKPPSTVQTTGLYLWDDNVKYFKWQCTSSEVLDRKTEFV